MPFIRKPRYEISSGAGGDSELGDEKNHIGGYGGEESGWSPFGAIRSVASAAARGATGAVKSGPFGMVSRGFGKLRRRGSGGTWRSPVIPHIGAPPPAAPPPSSIVGLFAHMKRKKRPNHL